jgi:hypothetical protein
LRQAPALARIARTKPSGAHKRAAHVQCGSTAANLSRCAAQVCDGYCRDKKMREKIAISRRICDPACIDVIFSSGYLLLLVAQDIAERDSARAL